ncbi:MAG TPA: hypothetical protein VNP98_08820 [Chthoniobacterales bacterium]|nr:hypothetical protein [Chthoniobacterales bacterium]
MNPTVNRDPRFYFSLPRFIALLRGGDTRRAESNAVEAWLVGLMMYLVHYLFFAHFSPSRLSPWLTALLVVLLAFWVWLFWLLLLYLNSLIIKLLRLGGLFRTIPIRRAQSILWGVCTTAMACALLEDSPWVREIGAIWLVAVALNLAAAVVLALSNATRPSGE